MKKLKLFSFVTALLSLGLIFGAMPKNATTEVAKAVDGALATSLDFADKINSMTIGEENMVDNGYYKDSNTNWEFTGGVTNMDGATKLPYLKFGAKSTGTETKSYSMLGPYSGLTRARRVDVYLTQHTLADGMVLYENQMYLDVYYKRNGFVYTSSAKWDKLETTASGGLHLIFFGHGYNYCYEGEDMGFGFHFNAKNNSNEDGIIYLEKFIISDYEDASVTAFVIWNYIINVYPGDSFYPNYEVRPANALNKRVYWSSDNPSVADVAPDGCITAKYGVPNNSRAIITGITDDGKFSGSFYVYVKNDCTKISETRFQTSSTVRKYKIQGTISEIVHYNGVEYVYINDSTGSLVLTNNSGTKLEKGATYDVNIQLPKITFDQLYAGIGEYFEKVTDGPSYTQIDAITDYANIEEANKPQIVNIPICRVTDYQEDSRYSLQFYRLGSKFVYAYSDKVYDPIAKGFNKVPMFSKAMEVKGLLVPIFQNRADYRLVLIPDETYKLATVKVNYYLDEGDGKYDLYQYKDFVIGDPIDNPTIAVASDKKLLGWSTDNENWTKFDFEDFATSNQINLFAKVINKMPVTVTFMVNSDIYFEEYGLEGDKFSAPTNPKLPNKIFVGWATTEGAIESNVNFSSPIALGTDTTYFAVFREPNDIKVILMNGDQKHDEINLKEGQNLLNAPYVYPTRDGKVFSGWYYDEDCKNYYLRSDELFENTTLYAGFRDYLDCSVTFRYPDEKEEIIKEITVKENSLIPLSEVPDLSGSTDGKTYKDWFVLKNDRFEKVDFSKFIVTENCELIAFEVRDGLFDEKSVRSQLYLNYTTNYDDHGVVSYTLNNASIHIGFFMSYVDYAMSNPGGNRISLLYGTDKSFASADAEYNLTLGSIDERINKIFSITSAELAPKRTGNYGYKDLGFNCIVNATPARVDIDGNPNEKGDYVQFGVTFNNVSLANLDTRIYVAAYWHETVGGTRVTYNSPIGISLRDICQTYLAIPNKNELYGDHLGVLEYLANYKGE